ncbi:hypothetical protein [Paraburkholderia unamae]|uniref:Uncharacterized protein n=1 Tax=Paraburkholderia unamae TaxID=219649 RepID=A0ACC6RGZ3_9BURK
MNDDQYTNWAKDWWQEHLRSRAKATLADLVAFQDKHGPDECLLRRGKLRPVSELIVEAVAQIVGE